MRIRFLSRLPRKHLDCYNKCLLDRPQKFESRLSEICIHIEKGPLFHDQTDDHFVPSEKSVRLKFVWTNVQIKFVWTSFGISFYIESICVNLYRFSATILFMFRIKHILLCFQQKRLKEFIP